MIITKLQGGLGNQMFQYAVARNLEKRTNMLVLLDLSFLKRHRKSKQNITVRSFELALFSKLRGKEMNPFQRKTILSKKLLFKLLRLFIYKNYLLVKQNETKLVLLPKDHQNIYLDGYFQSEKYFKSIRNELLRDFSFPILDSHNWQLSDSMQGANSVSIHIRRGDYIYSPEVLNHHGVLPLTYYRKAVDLLLKKTDTKLTFYIFSEDKTFVEENFGFLPNYEFVEGNTGLNSWKDMCLMKNCRHHIVANSSFSWWGAWLSDRDGTTIAPSQWLNPQNVDFDIHDFVPENWFIIDYE